jgi:hypothetical protein
LTIKPSFWMWRFSNVFLFLPICLSLYVWGAALFGPRVGMLSAIFLSASFYLHNFFLIGYLNPLAVLFVCALHAAWSVWTVRGSPKVTSTIALGLLTGVSFYVYLGPIILASVAPYVVYTLWRAKGGASSYRALVLCALIATAVILPVCINPETLRMMAQVSSYSSEFSDRAQVIRNIQEIFQVYWKNPRISHFVAGPYVDWITLCCIVAGVLSMIRDRRVGGVLLLMAFVTVTLLIGVTNPYTYPPTTRGIVLVPFGCLMAGLGADFVTRWLPRFFRVVCVVGLVLGVIVVNAERARLSLVRHGVPSESIVMRDIRAALKDCPTARVVRAHYARGLPQFNDLASLSLFVSIQVGREIQIISAEEDLPKGESSSDAVCEFYFTSQDEPFRGTL